MLPATPPVPLPPSSPAQQQPSSMMMMMTDIKTPASPPPKASPPRQQTSPTTASIPRRHFLFDNKTKRFYNLRFFVVTQISRFDEPHPPEPLLDRSVFLTKKDAENDLCDRVCDALEGFRGPDSHRVPFHFNYYLQKKDLILTDANGVQYYRVRIKEEFRRNVNVVWPIAEAVFVGKHGQLVEEWTLEQFEFG